MGNNGQNQEPWHLHTKKDLEHVIHSIENLAGIGTYEVDIQTNRCSFSPGMCQLLGEDPYSFEPDLDGIDSRSHPDDVILIRRKRERAARDQQPYNYTRRIRRKDGTWGMMESNGKVITDAEGNAIKYFEVVRDITSRNRVEEEEMRNKELLRTTIDSSLDMIQVFKAVRDEGGQIVDFTWTLNNKTSEQLYGDVIGKSLLRLNPGVVEEGIFETFKRVVETGIPHQSERHYVHEQFDGWFYQSTVKMDDGVATTTANITDLKRAEQEIKEQAHFIRSLTDTVPAVIALTDHPSNEIAFSTRNVMEILGFDADEVLEMGHAGRLKLIHPDDLDGVKAYYQRFDQMPDYEENRVNYRVANKHGDWVWFDVRGRVFKRDESGKVTQTLHMAFDDTENKIAGQELRKSKELLQQVIDAPAIGIAVYKAIRNEKGEIIDFIHEFINRASLKMLGGEDFTGRLFSDHGENALLQMPQFIKVIETGKANSYIREASLSGQKFWFSITNTAINGDRLVHTWQDVTERKEAEEQIKISRERLQATLDGSLYFIQAFKAIRSEEGEIVDFEWIFTNQMWNKHYGDMIGKRMLQQNPAVIETGLFGQFVQVVETGEPVDQEFYYSHEQFDDQWFHQTLVKLGDGFVMNTEDITARKKAEQDVHEKQALLESVMNNTESSIMLLKPVRNGRGKITDFEYVYANEQTLKSVDRTELVGKKMTEEFPELKNSALLNQYATVTETGENFRDEVDISSLGYPVWTQVFAQKFADGTLVTYFDITERKRAEREILRLKDEVAQKATDKYQALFSSIDEGFAIQDVVTDEDGNVTDVIYREVNEAFQHHTGMKDVLGRRVTEFLPHLEQNWLDALTKVYKTGKPLRAESYTADLDRWITYQYSRIGEAGSQLIAVVFNDVTERKQLEQLQTFLIKLGDSLRPLSDAMEVQRVAMQVLGEHLNVDRAIYAEINIDEDWFEATDNYTSKSVQKVTGRFPFAAFGPPGEKLKKGESLIIHDVNAEVDDGSKTAFYSIDVHAVVAVPLIKHGKLVADLSVHQTTPRNWLDHEIALIQETAERTWAAVEKAKAEEALRKSEEQFRRAIEDAPIPVICMLKTAKCCNSAVPGQTLPALH